MSFFRNLFIRRSSASKTIGSEAPPAPAAAIVMPRAAEPAAREEEKPALPAGERVTLPLKAITDLFTPEMKPALRKQPSEHVEVQIPKALIEPQLATGAVRITFAQLRAVTPEIFFHVSGTPPDAKVLLPLDLLVRRLKPARRQNQQPASIPTNIPAIFAKTGPAAPARVAAEPWYTQRRPTLEAQPETDSKAGMAPNNGKKAPAPEAEKPVEAPEPVAPRMEAEIAVPVPDIAPAPVAAPPVAGDCVPIPPAAIEPVEADVPEVAPAPVAPPPAAAACVPIPPATIEPVAAPVPEIAPPPVAPVAAACVAIPQEEAKAAPEGTVLIPLSMILTGFSEEIRGAFDGAKESLVVPLAEFEPRMRTGKLRFKWSELRGWCGGRADAPITDDTEIDLPMAAVVPLFMLARKPMDARKKVEIDARIPDVFGKANAAVDEREAEVESGPAAVEEPAPVAAADIAPAPMAMPVVLPAPVAMPAVGPPIPDPVAAVEPAPVADPAPVAASAAPTWASRPLRIEQAASPAVDREPEVVKMEPAAAGIEGQSGDWRSREAAAPVPEPKPVPAPRAAPTPVAAPAVVARGPAQIVQQIRALDGVSGAFIATSDGLLVAGDVPEANENILAAFAPTAFAQLSKYAEMARLGAPEAIDLRLASTTMHVRKAGKLYLGVLMPHGTPLPGPALHLISAALQTHAS